MITVLADTTAPDFAGATIDDQTYTKDTAITDLVLPPATDTGIVTYSLSPALPSGLIPAGAVTDLADPPTISGMPDTTSATMTYTYTAKDNATTPNTQTLTFTITVDDLPLVSIAGGASVSEGEAAEFTVTRVGVTTAALSVKVTVGGDAGFLPSPVSVEVGGNAVTAIAGEAGSFMVMIAASATEVDFTAGTEGDDVDEEDGMIEATVTAIDGSYRVDGTVTASVDVTDDDLPSITSFEIGGSSGSIVEDADPKTITVTVSEGTSLVDLDPTVVAVRSDATVAPGRCGHLCGRHGSGFHGDGGG